MTIQIPVLTWEKLVSVAVIAVISVFVIWVTKSTTETISDILYRWGRYTIYGIAFAGSTVFMGAVLIHLILPSRLKNPWVALGIMASVQWLWLSR